MTLQLSSRVRVAPHARFRRFHEEGIVIDQNAAEAIVVNETATRLLELLDGERTIAQCCDILEDEFDAPRTAIETDALRFAGELVDAKLADIRS